jgi:hypothetical protein
MTTTDKRQITELVKPILEKHGIDSLQLEIDLIGAFWRYVVERKAGRDIAQVRIDILKDMQVGATRVTEREAMESTIRSALGIDPTATPAIWDTVIDFLLKAEKRGERLAEFAQACIADPYGMPKAHQIAQKPSLIQSMWPKVSFSENKIHAKPDTKDGGYF